MNKLVLAVLLFCTAAVAQIKPTRVEQADLGAPPLVTGMPPNAVTWTGWTNGVGSTLYLDPNSFTVGPLGRVAIINTWRGTYDASQAYPAGAFVVLGGALYVSNTVVPANLNPPASMCGSPATQQCWSLVFTGGSTQVSGAGNRVDNEVPAGTIDGTNVAFTLSNAPSGATLHLYRNGIRQTPGRDFTLAGKVITFVAANVPSGPDALLADYSF